MQANAIIPARSRPRPNGRGFSLLEMVVVSVLLAIISVIAVPRFFAVARQREEKAISDVEDLLRMFAFRNSVGTQQIGLHHDARFGEVSLWILDLNPKDPEGPRVWQQDRLSNPVELPEGMVVGFASADGIPVRDDTWIISSHPDGSRPLIEIGLKGQHAEGTVMLDTYSTVPMRLDREDGLVRQPIDLDREGRTYDRW
ncbi:MAG: hypothetical protein RL136_651 [Planctomycetota bacterium]